MKHDNLKSKFKTMKYISPKTHTMTMQPADFIAESVHDEIGSGEYGKEAAFGWDDIDPADKALPSSLHSVWDDIDPDEECRVYTVLKSPE